MTVGANAAEMVNIMSNLGAALVPSIAGETFTNLERGIIEGVFFHFPVKNSSRYLEILECHTLFGNGGFYNGAWGYIINLKTWNSLPPDIQEIIEETYQWAADELAVYNYEYDKKTLEEVESRGDTIVELTSEELQLWYDLAEVEVEKWINQAETEGWPAREIYEELLRLMEEYN